MSRMNLSVIVEKNKGLEDNLTAMFALVKSAIPEQGAQVNVTIIPLPSQHDKITLDKLFPKIFRPKEM